MSRKQVVMEIIVDSIRKRNFPGRCQPVVSSGRTGWVLARMHRVYPQFTHAQRKAAASVQAPRLRQSQVY